MKRMLATAALTATLLSAPMALAAERSVTLKVEYMTCPTCPYIIKKSLSNVPGVEKVEVSFQDKTAVVIFDDAKTNVSALTAATTNVGFPSRAVE